MDFAADDEDSDDSSSSDSESDSDSDSGGEAGGAEAEVEDLEEEAQQAAAAGPSSGAKRKRAPADPDAPKILEGLSGDEVDANLIITGGRGARRGRPGGARPKYAATAEAASDEDSW